MNPSDATPAFKLSSYEKWFFGIPIGFGLVCSLALGLTAHLDGGSWQFPLKAIALLFLAAGTAFAGGAFLGFLFGVPRVAPPAVVGAVNAPALPTAAPALPPRAAVITSTSNLVEIADWLLKLLLGAGLTQFHAILHTIRQIATDLGAGLSIPASTGPNPGVETGVAISFSIGYFFVWGCIMSYVLTQEWMPVILERRLSA